MILAIDPGNKQSAWMVYDGTNPRIFGIDDNDVLLASLIENANFSSVEYLAIEMVASYGMAVGETVFETCVWIGRFIQAWDKPYAKVYRKDIKMHLCNSMRAKDANIRQAVLDRYPATGGGKTPQVGTKKQPGPLFGVSKDVWSALAVAITFTETFQSDNAQIPTKPRRKSTNTITQGVIVGKNTNKLKTEI